MDRDPALYLTTFMRRAEILVQPTPMTELQCLSFLLDQFLGRHGNVTNQPLGFLLPWIIDASTMRTLLSDYKSRLVMVEQCTRCDVIKTNLIRLRIV